MPRANISAPLAVLAALSLAIVSYACVVSCWGVEAAIPPCHHHKSSCAPLLLTSEAPGVSVAAEAAAPAFSPALAVATRASEADANEIAPLSPLPLDSPPALASPAPTILRI
jgi:hypothetical protein